MNLGVVIIGLNEGNYLNKCFKSLKKLSKNFNTSYIYIDSSSVDNSIEIAKKNKIPFEIISGKLSAARSRNFGASYLKNVDFLLFSDGDMEFNEVFLNNLYSMMKENDFFSVGRKDLFYHEGNIVRTKDLTKENESFDIKTGGHFVIKNDLWKKLKGMNENYLVNEDIDFSFRLKKLFNQKPFIYSFLGFNHHTVEYLNKDRINNTFSLAKIKSKVLLLREHFFLYPIYFLKRDISVFILILTLIFSIVTVNIIIIYIFFKFLEAYIRNKKKLDLFYFRLTINGFKNDFINTLLWLLPKKILQYQ
jgi:glycosyltransferase involved in cell wall biosynthesis